MMDRLTEQIMSNDTKFIDGEWVEPITPNLSTSSIRRPRRAGQISLGSSQDVDRAVAAARRAFPAYSQTSREERIALLQRIIDGFEARNEALAHAMTVEMGSPITFSNEVQTVNALTHFKEMIAVLKSYEFERFMGGTLICREPIGVCGLITPWNWPLNQVASKLAPAIATGCTAVLKPSEIAPLSSIIFAEVLHEAGVPKGVFNLVNGDGPTVGEAISAHPGIDMVSFTGSTRAGILVAKGAASTVKRVVQELGGKSANIILPDADLAKAVLAVLRCFTNTGQSPPTRPVCSSTDPCSHRYRVAAQAAERSAWLLFDQRPPWDRVVSKSQFDKVQDLIERGLRRVHAGAGGTAGRLQPRLFTRHRLRRCHPRHGDRQRGIFGPVLSMMATTRKTRPSRSPTTPPTAGPVTSGGDTQAPRRGEARRRAHPTAPLTERAIGGAGNPANAASTACSARGISRGAVPAIRGV